MKCNLNFVGTRKYWYALSTVMLLAGIIAMVLNVFNPAIRAPFKLGIDFTGGTEIRVNMPAQFTEDDVAERLQEFNISRESLKSSKNELIIAIQGSSNSVNNSISDALQAAYGVEQKDISVDMVGPSIGKELQRNALVALVIGLMGIMLYVTIRYDYKFAVSGIIALLHDALVLLGFFAITKIPINSFIVPALLTAVGYSMNDTVIIFDRIRENLRLDKQAGIEDVVNRSINQTLSRSLNTMLNVEFTVIALMIFGGASIHSLAIAMFIGLTCGCYSSIFNASQILVDWKLAEQKKKNTGRAKIAGGSASAALRIDGDGSTAAVAADLGAQPNGGGTSDAGSKAVKHRPKKKRY
ncbi:MAG: protein translocase subunit SecF [bacterium]|nr:protein translocase subunit SecF [bacterium]